jgi:hypothetical protein
VSPFDPGMGWGGSAGGACCPHAKTQAPATSKLIALRNTESTNPILQ